MVADDPDLRFVQASDYALDKSVPALASWIADMEQGRGIVSARGLPSNLYSDTLSAAIFLGLNIGEPMRQNELGVSFMSERQPTIPQTIQKR